MIASRIKRIFDAYPQPFWVLMTGTFIDRVGTNLILPFLAIYVAQKFDAQITQVGALFTIYALSGAAGNFLAGALADRFGRRFTLIAGMICAATARVGLGFADNFTALYIAAAFAGLFGAIGWPAQLAMTSDLLGPEKRAGGFGIQRVIINATFALGPLASVMLAPQIGYLWLFILDALTSYFVAILVFSKLPETLAKKQLGAPTENFVQTMIGYKRVLQDRVFTAFLLISILISITHQQMNTALSLFLVKFQNLPESFFAMLVMINALMIVFLQIPISRWGEKRPMLLMMICGAAFYLVGFGSYGVTTAVPLFVFGMVMITAGEMLVIPTSQALTAFLAPKDMRARYVAAERLNLIVAQSLGPLAAAALMDYVDPRWVWYGCAILCAISIGGFFALHLYAGNQLATKQAAPAAEKFYRKKIKKIQPEEDYEMDYSFARARGPRRVPVAHHSIRRQRSGISLRPPQSSGASRQANWRDSIRRAGR